MGQHNAAKPLIFLAPSLLFVCLTVKTALVQGVNLHFFFFSLSLPLSVDYLETGQLSGAVAKNSTHRTKEKGQLCATQSVLSFGLSLSLFSLSPFPPLLLFSPFVFFFRSLCNVDKNPIQPFLWPNTGSWNDCLWFRSFTFFFPFCYFSSLSLFISKGVALSSPLLHCDPILTLLCTHTHTHSPIIKTAEFLQWWPHQWS